MSRLLMIEDDPDIRKLLQRYLERAGMQVVLAGEGEEGLQAFSRERFDVVLIDGLLPKKNGFEVVVALRKMPRGSDVGIIMMTAAFKTPRARKEAMDGGADAFFTKPFVLHDLKAKIDELLARSRAAALPRTTTGAGSPLPRTTTGAGSPLPRTTTGAGSPLPRTTTSAIPVRAVEPASAAPPAVERLSMPSAKIEELRQEVRHDVTPRPRPQPTPPLPDGVTVKSPSDVAQVLLQCARHRLSGTVRLADESSQLVIAFLRGVVVGASDNLREQLLGEMLWKQGRLTTEQMRDLNMRMANKGERTAEALLALGFISADEMLTLVNEQARARVRRALMWTGKLKVVVDEADALKRAVDSVELLDVLLAFALEPGQQEEAQRFVATHKVKALKRGPSFDDVLVALARTKPDATLPGVLLAGSPNVGEAACGASPSEVYAGHLAELVRLPEDPFLDPRPLPTMLRSDVTAMLVDRALTNRVSALLLKARGQSAYAFFDLPCTATDEQMVASAATMLAKLRSEIGTGGSLGPALAAARELLALLEDYRELFADPMRRAMHDALWNELPLVTPKAPGPEDAFLEGQIALGNGDVAAALVCFQTATSTSNDVEYQSWLAWTRVLSGDVAGGIKGLMGAMRDHPQSMRPMFFLGLHAAQNGDMEKARALLVECTRRSPHDVEVQAALSALD